MWGEDVHMSKHYVLGEDKLILYNVCQTIPNDSVFIVIYVHSRNITCEVKIYNV